MMPVITGETGALAALRAGRDVGEYAVDRGKRCSCGQAFQALGNSAADQVASKLWRPAQW